MMALYDSGSNTTLMDESLALVLGLQGKEVDLQIQGVNAQKVFTSQHIKKCSVARVGEENIKYSLRDVKTIPNLNGPDQKLKWSTIKHEYQHLKDLDLHDTDTGPVQMIIGTNNSDLILPKQIVKPSGESKLKEYLMQLRPCSDGQSLTGYRVNTEYHHPTVGSKFMKEVQLKTKS